MLPKSERTLHVLVRYRDEHLEPLSDLPLPEGWIGHVAIADTEALGAQGRYRTADLQLFQGSATAVAELSESHDQLLRAQAVREIDEPHA